MDIFRIISLIGAFLSCAGTALFLYFNYQVVSLSSGVMDAHARVTNPSDPLQGSNLDIINHRMASGRGFRAGYEELARFGDIKAPRYVRFEAHVPVRDLLERGESKPEKAFRDVFARTRGLYYAREECKRVMRDLASECEVHSASGSYRDDVVFVSARLRFVQKAEFGKADIGRAWSYESVRNSVTKRGLTVSVRDEERERERAYRKVVKECESIRKRSGNCAITDVSVDVSKNRKNERKVRFNVYARYSMLLPAN